MTHSRSVFLALLILFLASARWASADTSLVSGLSNLFHAWNDQAHRPLMVPEPWGCPAAPDIGGSDIYSPEPVQQSYWTLVYFGGWAEQCRIHDAIYMARMWSGWVFDLRPVITPEDVGLIALNDPAIVTRHDPLTGRDYLLMYLTGVATDTGHVADNKIYLSASWADDGIHWSVPVLLLDGVSNPGAAVHPETDEVWVWAYTTGGTATGDGLRAFNLGRSGVSLRSNAPVQPNLFQTSVSARWQDGQWDILTSRWDEAMVNVIDRWASRDGVHWEMVTPQFIVPPAGFQAITPAFGLDEELYYGRYHTAWPPNSSVWVMKGAG